jgi:hypothetical protein
MPFPQVAARRRTLTIFDHLMVIAIASLPLAAFRETWKPGAVALSLVLLLVGYLLWWLPGLGVRTRRPWIDSLVLPAFMTLMMGYVFLAFLAFFHDPHATAFMVAAQLMALVYVSVRL